MKAIALFSGGLDSTLAIKIIQEQNIDIEAVYINVGFESDFNKIEKLKQLVDEIEVGFRSIDIRDKYIQDILFSPKYGYGKNFNPCVDCHANMIRVAKQYMQDSGANFIISGEVLGQRPMSQTKEGLMKIQKISEEEGLVLRPLSAKLLEPTIPELKGWVDREKLYDIYGRQRDKQFELVKKYNLKNYESPSGGCLLTDANFAIKLKDFVSDKKLEVEDIDILKVGRHMRVNGYTFILSRNKDENQILKSYTLDKFKILRPINIPGPIGLLDSKADYDTKQLASNILLTYTKANEGEVSIGDEIFGAKSFDSKDEIKKYLLLGDR